MAKHPFGLPRPEDRQAWIDITMGRRAPTHYFQGGQVLNVFTGEIWEAGVALYNDRIAYVGPEQPLLDDTTQVIDVSGAILVPGYIEIHVHPFQLNSPATFTTAIAMRGTTTMVADTLQMLSLMGTSARQWLDSNWGAPVRTLWGLRTAPQTQPYGAGSEQERIHSAFGISEAELIELLDHPRVIQAFEWSSWAPAVRDGAPVPEVIMAALQRSMRVDLHAPGASPRTLAALAAAGATDCHESLTVDDVLNRVRQGLYAPLRYSALRPDLPELVGAVRAVDGFERLMLTSDGAMPDYLTQGLMDQVIATAINHGVKPADAIRMATLHPAAYLGLDAHIGAIAPGRLADILVLSSLDNPTPRQVYIGGQLIDGSSLPQWDTIAGGVPSPVFQQLPTPDHYKLFPDDVGVAARGGQDGTVEVPVVKLLNPVISKLETVRLPLGADGSIDFAHDPSLVLAVLWDEKSGHVVKALVQGMGSIPGGATTYSCAYAPVVLGRDPEAMARSARRLQDNGSGIYLDEKDRELFTLRLPIAGMMSDLPPGELARRCQQLQEVLTERGFAFHAPLYMLLFLTADHLPGPRLTAAGLWDVRSRRVIYGPRSFQ